jgi:hypothetical protein
MQWALALLRMPGSDDHDLYSGLIRLHGHMRKCVDAGLLLENQARRFSCCAKRILYGWPYPRARRLGSSAV